MTSTIRALFIYEIMGRPPEHIKEALDKFIISMGEQKGIEITSKSIHEPKPVEAKEAKDLYTTFAEVEMAFDNLHLLFAVVLNTLPSSIDILSPNELILRNFDLSSVLSELAVKLHKYDEVAKTMALERDNLIANLNNIRQNQGTIPVNITMGKSEDAQEMKKTDNKKSKKSKKVSKK